MNVITNIKTLCAAFIVLIGCVLACSNVLASDKRLAFIVGNSVYDEVVPLANPTNDALDLGVKLQALGFELYQNRVHLNLNRRDFRQRFSRFVEYSKGAEIAFFFFAGHGMQFNGDPHLLPIDIPNGDLEFVRGEAIDLNELIASLDNSAKLSIAVFDACREIPEYQDRVAQLVRGGSDFGRRGLSRTKVSANGALIAYSGGAGQLVADGVGQRNSPYSTILLEHLSREKLEEINMDVPSLFAEVAYQFRLRHKGQNPELMNQGVPPNRHYWIKPEDSLANVNGKSNASEFMKAESKVISHKAGEKAQHLGEEFNSSEIEKELWELAKSEDTVQGFELYLKKFPSGFFADFAALKVEQLRRNVEFDEDKHNDIGLVSAHVASNSNRAQQREIVNDVQTRQSYEPEMVLVVGGILTMGSEWGDRNEQPVHEVAVKSFEMSKYEVTFYQYDAFARAEGKPMPEDQGWGRGNRPVINISWNDAQEYVLWLNANTDGGYRLPSESEWEYAARAGGKGKFHFGDSESQLCVYANGSNVDASCNDGFLSQTASVGNYQSNHFGLYDMSGNVWEWVEDCWHEDYKDAPVSASAWVTGGDCSKRVLRGGSWDNKPFNLRNSNRISYERSYSNNDLGFRLSRTISQ